MTSGRLAISASFSFSFSSYFGAAGLFDCAEAGETKARDRTAAVERLETERMTRLPLSALTNLRNLMAASFRRVCSDRSENLALSVGGVQGRGRHGRRRFHSLT